MWRPLGKSKSMYVAKAEPGIGWRIWNTKMKRYWGEVYAEPPEVLLQELNGQKRPAQLTALNKQLKK